MEENVALDSSKQKQFVKSVKGIKKLIKKSEDKAKAEDKETEKASKGRDGKDRKKKRKRGLVYLSHIPHGFYEHQMTQYFKQFGVVTNARVIRSKRTGNSKGFAFVEFKDPAVGQIVAETMNNYLMGKRLIKAVYIPPGKQRPAMRKHWSSTHNPASENRIKMKKAYNANKDEKGDLEKARKLLANATKTKTKLAELGINYDFFTPVDVPEGLLNDVEVKVEETEEKRNVAKNKKAKKEVKFPEVDVKVSQKDNKTKVKGVQKTNVTNKQENKKDTSKVLVQETKSTKKEQKQKKQSLKDKGVQPLEEFIKIGDDSDNDSDSSYAFDSDEYTKMIENDDESNSNVSGDESDDDDGSGDDGGDSEATDSGDNIVLRYEDSDEDLTPNPKQKNKPVKKVQQVAQTVVKKNTNKQEELKPQQVKRKAHQSKDHQKPVSPPKKPKFEKHNNQKPLNKQFKKKK